MISIKEYIERDDSPPYNHVPMVLNEVQAARLGGIQNSKPKELPTPPLSSNGAFAHTYAGNHAIVRETKFPYHFTTRARFPTSLAADAMVE